MDQNVESIACPYCSADDAAFWAEENGFTAVKCNPCGFIYVNPRPAKSIIKDAVETGYHMELPDQKSAVARRIPWRIGEYRRVFKKMYSDVWAARQPISWLDIGAGYGEVVEAVISIAPKGSVVEGVEPMKPKARVAKELGLPVHNGYLKELTKRYDFVSLVHVFSHIADFRSFLEDIKTVLNEGGQFYFETGNAADLKSRFEVPTELDLPDHLTFAGKAHIIGFLEQAGFKVVQLDEIRRDGLINFAKNIVKKLIGRNVHLRIPYTSGHRAIRVRARLVR